MFREQYNQLNKQISPDKILIQSTINKAKKYESKHFKQVYSFRKPIITLASIFIFCSLAMPVLASNVDSIYRLMYMVSPSVAQFFMPVQKSDEYNGIKMEVVSAYIHNNVAEIYITIKDLVSDRVDETTDLFDSYDINLPFDSSAHCDFIEYNKDTKSATFLISITQWNDKNIVGDKITFTVREFLSHKKTYDDISVPIDLSTVSIAKNTQTISSTGGGGSDDELYAKFEENPIALVPSSPISNFPVAGIDLTAIGYINGNLHIQTAVKNSLDNDNHGFFYFKDSNGNKINNSYTFYFINHSEKPGRIDYCNYVFDIPQNELTNYTLHGDFVTSGLKTEGNWRVTFPLVKSKQ